MYGKYINGKKVSQKEWNAYEKKHPSPIIRGKKKSSSGATSRSKTSVKDLYDEWNKNRNSRTFKNWISAVKEKRDSGKRLNKTEMTYLGVHESSSKKRTTP